MTIRIAALVVALSAAGGALAQEAGAPPPAAPAAPAPAAPAPAGNTESLFSTELKDLKDAPRTLAEFKGKPLVVYFFATWCAPCHKETPKLVKLYEDNKAKGLTVIGVALDNADKTRAFAEKYGATYPIVYGGRPAVQMGKDLGNDKGAIPFTVIIGKDGKIIETIKGDTPDGKLEQVLQPALG